MNIKFARQVAPYINTYQAMRDGVIEKPLAETTCKATSLSQNEKAILGLAEKIWAEYQRTPEGIAFLESFKTADLPTARKKVNELADGPVFNAIKELISLAENYNIIPKCFSVGVNIQAEFIIGFTITLGVAIGVGDDKGVNMSEFLSIGVTEGLDEGAFIGIEFGLWTNAPDSINGWSLSTAVEAGVGIDGSFAVSYSKNGGILGATVVVALGEEDGADEAESYTFILGKQNPTHTRPPGDGFYLQPTYQPRFQKKNILIIESLVCTNTAAASGNDEVYFTFQADGGYTYFYPTYDYYSMDDDDHPWSSWNCGRSVWFNDSVTITLYDDGAGNHQNATPLFPNINFKVDLDNLILGQTKSFYLHYDPGAFSGETDYTVNIRLVAVNVEHTKVEEVKDFAPALITEKV